jgi:hypothetical protein
MRQEGKDQEDQRKSEQTGLVDGVRVDEDGRV